LLTRQARSALPSGPRRPCEAGHIGHPGVRCEAPGTGWTTGGSLLGGLPRGNRPRIAAVAVWRYRPALSPSTVMRRSFRAIAHRRASDACRICAGNFAGPAIALKYRITGSVGTVPSHASAGFIESTPDCSQARASRTSFGGASSGPAAWMPGQLGDRSSLTTARSPECGASRPGQPSCGVAFAPEPDLDRCPLPALGGAAGDAQRRRLHRCD